MIGSLIHWFIGDGLSRIERRIVDNIPYYEILAPCGPDDEEGYNTFCHRVETHRRSVVRDLKQCKKNPVVWWQKNVAGWSDLCAFLSVRCRESFYLSQPVPVLFYTPFVISFGLIVDFFEAIGTSIGEVASESYYRDKYDSLEEVLGGLSRHSRNVSAPLRNFVINNMKVAPWRPYYHQLNWQGGGEEDAGEGPSELKRYFRHCPYIVGLFLAKEEEENHPSKRYKLIWEVFPMEIYEPRPNKNQVNKFVKGFMETMMVDHPTQWPWGGVPS